MAEITLRGRRIPLVYTTWEMKQIQTEFYSIQVMDLSRFSLTRMMKLNT